MEIRQAYVYGFGKWVDFSADFSSGKIQLIYGENESGKSTLNKFLLFMLFGLPPKERAIFRPKKSSKFGGKLIVFDETYGEFVIERVEQHKKAEAICKTGDGKTHDEAWLKERLNGMTVEIYQSIYGFSADDLSGIDQIKEEDLGEVLLGIGFTGASKIHQIEKRLSSKLGELFKPGGKVPEINRELEKLEHLQEKMIVYQHEESDYLEKKQAMLDVENQMKQLHGKREDVQKRHLELEKLQQALPALKDYQTTAEQLQKMPAVIPFPQEGIKRLTVLKDKLLPLKSELSVLEKNRKTDLEELAKLKKEMNKFPEKQVQEFHVNFAQFQQQQTEITKCEQSILQDTIALKAILTDLDIGLSAEDAAKLHLPFHTEKTWEQIKSDKEKSAMEQENVAKEKRFLDEQQAYLEAQHQELQGELLSSEKRKVLEEEQINYQEQGRLQTIAAETVQGELQWQQLLLQRTKKSHAYLYISLFLCLIFIISSMIAQQFSYAILAAVSLMFGIIQWRWQKNNRRSMEKTMSNILSASGNEKQTISEEAYQQGKRLLDIDNQNLKDADALYEKIKDLDIQLVRWEENSRLMQQQKDQIASKIDEQVKLYPFLDHVNISSWPSLYHAGKNIQRISKEIERQKMSMRQLQTSNEDFRHNLTMFVQKMDWVSESIDTKDMSTDVLMKKINEKEKQYFRYQQRMYDMNNSMDKINADMQVLKEEIAVYQSEIELLYQTAQVENEETYYEAAERSQLQNDLKKEQQRLRKQFTIYYNDEEWEELAKQIPKQNELEWQYDQTAEVILELDRDMAKKRKDHARLQAELSQMEDTHVHSSLFHQSQVHKDRINELARKWSVLKMAKGMLDETKRSFRNKYLDQVIRNTSIYFSELTGNKYERVIAPVEKQPFLVESPEKTTYTVNELSKGTMDQLYVSLRLAISEVISGENHLPIMIDDGFVHFDTVRNDRMMKILENIANHRQILLFSCRIAPDELERGNVIELTTSVRI